MKQKNYETIPIEFVRNPWRKISTTGQYLKDEKNKGYWLCNKCKKTTDVATFMEGRCEMVTIIDINKRISRTYGRLYFCPHCLSIMYSVGYNCYFQIDTQYKKDLLLGAIEKKVIEDE